MKQHPRIPSLFVDDEGRVFRELTPSRDPMGYHQIRNGEIRERRHTIVCEAFHGERPGPEYGVRHLDGDPENDSPQNLAWGTQAENMADAVRHGTTTRGRRNAAAKLEAENVLEIRARRTAGESLRSIADSFGISISSVCDIQARRTWGWL